MKFYELKDYLTKDDLLKLGFDTKEKVGQPLTSYIKVKNVKAINTGEMRPPKKGEWYLSGAIVEAYRAPNDLTTAFYIAKLVRVKSKTVIEIVCKDQPISF